MFAVPVIVVRASADKILAVNDAELATAPTGAIQVGMVGDAAVNHRDTYSRAVPAGLPGGLCVHRSGGIVKRAAQSPVRRDIGHIGIVRQGIQRLNRNGIVRALDEVQLGLQNPALVLYLLMVGLGRCLIELYDYDPGGADVAAFENVKVVRQFVLVAIS